MLSGRRQACVGCGISNDPVCIEVHLPVVRVVAIRSHRQNGTGKSEGEDLFVGRRISQHIRDLGQVGFESGDDSVNIDEKFWMMSPKIFPLTHDVAEVSRVLIEVTNKPTSSTVPVTPPATTTSPTLNGCRMTRKIPAAKFASNRFRRRRRRQSGPRGCWSVRRRSHESR